jgi:hypothetical protein
MIKISKKFTAVVNKTTTKGQLIQGAQKSLNKSSFDKNKNSKNNTLLKFVPSCKDPNALFKINNNLLNHLFSFLKDYELYFFKFIRNKIVIDLLKTRKM